MNKRNENRPGYRETRVGWIPADWSFSTFGQLLQRVREPVIVEPNISYQEIGLRSHGKGVFHKEPIKGVSIGNKSVFWVQYPALIFNIVFAWEQAVAVTSAREQGMIASHRFPMYKQKRNNVDLSYVFYFFLTKRGKHLLGMASPGGAGRNKTLGQGELYRVPMPHPPIPEQKKIAEILSTWDGAIEQTRKLIDAKKRRKKALMQQLLTGKKRLPGFKEKWKTYRLNELIKQISRRVEFDDHAIYDLISVRRRSGGVFNRGKMPGHTIRTKQMYLAKRGDFLISKMQIVHGASALATKEFDSKHISGSYIALRVRDSQKLDVYFLNWLSKTPHFYHLTYLSSYGVHIEKMTFNLRLFLKSKISIPEDIKEQRCIVEALSTADGEIEQLEVKLKALEKQKRGLMQKLLTGEVRVSV